MPGMVVMPICPASGVGAEGDANSVETTGGQRCVGIEPFGLAYA